MKGKKAVSYILGSMLLTRGLFNYAKMYLDSGSENSRNEQKNNVYELLLIAWIILIYLLPRARAHSVELHLVFSKNACFFPEMKGQKYCTFH